MIYWASSWLPYHTSNILWKSLHSPAVFRGESNSFSIAYHHKHRIPMACIMFRLFLRTLSNHLLYRCSNYSGIRLDRVWIDNLTNFIAELFFTNFTKAATNQTKVQNIAKQWNEFGWISKTICKHFININKFFTWLQIVSFYFLLGGLTSNHLARNISPWRNVVPLFNISNTTRRTIPRRSHNIFCM